MTAYELEGVRFAYGDRPPVLNLPRLQVPAGSVTTFRGPNGSGKTTLLHLLAFLAQPTAGRVRFFGEPVRPRDGAALRRQVCLLLQNPYLFRGSVHDNVEWPLRVRGISASDRRRAADEALERVGLSALRDRSARELSGGESQRAALARVLVLNPRAVCLDEPTNHLDASGRATVEEVLTAWVAERGGTLLIATHDMGFAHRLGAQIWDLQGGELMPAEPDNVLQGRVADGNRGLFETSSVNLAVHPLEPEVRSVRISPREVVLSRESLPSSARNQLAGQIVAVTSLPGDELLVRVDCGILLHAVITRDSWETLGLERGGAVVAVFKASAVQAC